ncbi:MAG TPA: hypothetical protein VFX43_10635 [Chitinophagaceae bacterium]|nr:hypothetical protein [Chitinophagaceae bacterium]
MLTYIEIKGNSQAGGGHLFGFSFPDLMPWNHFSSGIMNRKALQIANGIALLVVLIINGLAGTRIFNGNTLADVSARYANYFTPAGYAFFIWIIIYLGLIGFVVYGGRGLFTRKEDDRELLEIGWWFVVSCIANCLWVLAWLYDFTGLSVLLMGVLLFSLGRIIVNTDMEKRYDPLSRFVFIWWPFSFYSAWILVAFMANVAAYLTKLKEGGQGISVGLAVIMIIVTAIINLWITWNRNMREFAMVGAWGLVAVAVANWHGQAAIVWSAMVAAVIVLASSMIHGYKNREMAYKR